MNKNLYYSEYKILIFKLFASGTYAIMFFSSYWFSISCGFRGELQYVYTYEQCVCVCLCVCIDVYSKTMFSKDCSKLLKCSDFVYCKYWSVNKSAIVLEFK